MVSYPLLKRNITTMIKPFLILFAVLCMYTVVIIYMYNPEFADMLNDYQAALPEMMSAVGMSGIASNLVQWIQIYLYGFIMMLFPLIFIIILMQKLLNGYIDSGSMANLLATPNSRRRIILTQMFSAVLWVVFLMICITAAGLVSSQMLFPGELDIKRYLILNGSACLMQLAITGIVFLAACIFNESRQYYALGAGLPILFFLIQMVSNMGEKMENLKYATIYTLFPAEKIVEEAGSYWQNNLILFLTALVLFSTGCIWFQKKDLPL